MAYTAVATTSYAGAPRWKARSRQVTRSVIVLSAPLTEPGDHCSSVFAIRQGATKIFTIDSLEDIMNSSRKIARFPIALFLSVLFVYSQEAVSQVILHQNYANPSNPTTIINYQLLESSHVSLKVYDILGRVVTTLVDEWQTAGTYRAIFSANNLSSGIYFYNLRAGQFNETRKLLFVK
jgi:Secretion system C-terminal sorting domain